MLVTDVSKRRGAIPTSGTYCVGDEFISQDGAKYLCVTAGTPGTWVMVSQPTAVTGFTSRQILLNGIVATVTDQAADGTGWVGGPDASNNVPGFVWSTTTNGWVRPSTASMEWVGGRGTTIGVIGGTASTGANTHVPATKLSFTIRQIPTGSDALIFGLGVYYGAIPGQINFKISAGGVLAWNGGTSYPYQHVTGPVQANDTIVLTRSGYQWAMMVLRSATTIAYYTGIADSGMYSPWGGMGIGLYGTNASGSFSGVQGMFM